jgi:hypothetical protein
MANTLPVPWDLIEKFCITGGSFAEAAAEFNVKLDTIRKRAQRYSWPLPKVIAKAAAKSPARQKRVNQAIIARKAETWEEKGEAHRQVVFDKAHTALKKMKPTPPRNWREAEAADKMARRAAGLENIDSINQTLIQLNDAVNEHDVVEANVVEAELVTEALPANAE